MLINSGYRMSITVRLAEGIGGRVTDPLKEAVRPDPVGVVRVP